MNLIKAAIDNPVKVAVGVFFVVLFGIVGLLRMPIQLAPEVEVPRISVETTWLGASPAEVETEIVKEQEEQLNTVEGLYKLESESRDSSARIILEFPVGTDINAASLLINNRLNQVKEYPVNADRPVISTVDSANNRPIAWFMLRPREDNARLIEIEHLRTFVVNDVEPEFEKVPGVAAANTFGGREKRLEVIVDPHQLSARQITIAQLRNALLEQNQDTSGGDFWEGKRRYALRTLGRFRSPTDVEGVIVVRREGQPVYVRDVAQVRIGYKKPDSVVRQKGKTTIALNVLRSTGTNVLEVMAGVKDKVVELNAGLLKDRGLEIVQVYDETEYITAAIGRVEVNIVAAGVLTVAVLLLFLRSGWPTLVVALAIPTSIIGTFFVFSSFGRTLNVVSLGGMAFAVGMVVDNAIVVLENIYRHFEMGKSRVQAALEGAKEVWGAVLASTLTTLAVFLPVIFVKEEAGQLFADISIAISCAVGLSLVAAMTVIPTASARILRRGGKAQKGQGLIDHLVQPLSSNVVRKSRQGFGQRFVQLVAGSNRWIQQRVVTRLATVLAAAFLSIYGTYLLWPNVEYLPEGNRNFIVGLLLPPPGYNVEQMIEIGKGIEEKLKPFWGPEAPGAKERGAPAIQHFFFVARGRQLFMGASSVEPERAAELIPVLQEAVADVPGMIPLILQTSLFEGALQGGRSIDIEITGDQLEKLVGLGGRIFGQIMGMSQDPSSPLYGCQVRPIPSLDLSNPEVHVIPKWEQAADLGISARELGYAVDALVDGAFAGEYYDRNDKIDLEIVGADEFAARTDQLDYLYIAAATGDLVPLSAIADVHLASGPEQINHRERRRAITVQVKPSIATPLDAARQYIEGAIVAPLRDSGALEGGRFRIDLGGTADKLVEAWSALNFNLILALIITYFLMAGLFESFLFPFVIIMSVPLAAVGGVAALWFTNLGTTTLLNQVTSLDIVTMLGFVILIGTAVNNPILIVHQSLNLMREEGCSQLEAVVESTRTRIRPIFMSTGTTVLGLLPLVVMPGSGSEIYRGLGAVVLGGLVTSTVVTLVMVPALFTLMLDAKRLVTSVLFSESASHTSAAVAASLEMGMPSTVAGELELSPTAATEN